MAEKPLTSIKGIGPRRAEALGKLGLFSLMDLVRFAPRDYLDFSKQSLAADCAQGADAALRVVIDGPARQIRARGGLVMTLAHAADETGRVDLVWYNQPYRARSVKPGLEAFACGKIDKRRGLKLVNPTFYQELPGILPVYPVSGAVSQNLLRSAARAALACCLAQIEETLPAPILKRYALMPLGEAFCALHAPASFEQMREARRRLAFEDMLLYSLVTALLRNERREAPGIAFQTKGLREEYIAKLPYRPTAAQMRAMAEIEHDMAAPFQMNRLLQGDVGSGKTMVAMFAMYVAIKNGKAAALMAPTEILAAQHFEKLKTVFGSDAVVLTGGMKAAERREALARILEKPRAVVGTHALIGEGLALGEIGLVIADEQHRFGVRQRAAIAGKGRIPDMLIMSATPIPRTLSMILYGDLELSVLDELPPGRKPVVTRIVPADKRAAMYGFVEQKIKEGAQVFAVCPLVEESDALADVQSARALYAELCGTIPARIGLIHGGLSHKQAVAAAFRRGEIDLLVSTTVVEVGVDVPNASVMVVENAERFGLAQLHQLRGRVGRGAAASYCFLLGTAEGVARERLQALASTNDGFEIARRDLELRGPGEFLGTRQHGMDDYALSRFAGDMRVLNDAREAAAEIAGLSDAASLALVARAREKLDGLEKTLAKN